MTQAQERRAEGQSRMAVETLVEVVGNEPGTPAFEAESVDVSARGMHLRTAYLPDQGAPLVCRFEEHGREVVVEGVVAWRREGARGGEFGVEFTALDASSVGALRELCEGDKVKAKDSEPAEDPPHTNGAKVRLHIDGLGSPMKARVRSGDTGRVQVGSSLEFLKVGRRLEIEDLERGGRRTAHIDSVNVAIDPENQVPQLVVALRYEGAEETTPEPSVADLSGQASPRTLRIPGDNVSVSSGSDDDSIEDEGDREVEALRGKLGVAATHAGEAAVSAGKRVAALSSAAATSLSGFLRGAAAKAKEASKREKPAQRRTTAPAPSAPAPTGQRLRPQSGAAATESAAQKPGVAALAGAWTALPKKKKVMASVGVAVMLATLVALATRHGAPPPGAEAGLPKAEAVVGNAAPAAAATGVTAPGSKPEAPNALTEANGVVSADVPLFGAQPMATMEPAPLAPPPSSDAASEEAAEKAEAKASVSAAADDETFPEDESKSSKSKSSKKPEDVAPWGRGKLTTPVIHRLRLDSAGDALQGSLQPTGFTVVVPNRKVMEQGAGIAKRDPRIARVRTVNTPNGAQITLQFKDGIPAYKTRLRRDFVEILLGAPEPKKADKPAEKEKSKVKPASSAKPKQ
jgi:PilZ domain